MIFVIHYNDLWTSGRKVTMNLCLSVRPSACLCDCNQFSLESLQFFLKFCDRDLETGKSDRDGLTLVYFKRKASISFEFLHGDINQGTA